MGCACTKGELIGPGKNGLERRRSSNAENTTNESTIKTKETSEKKSETSGLLRSLSWKKPLSMFRESQMRPKTNTPNDKLKEDEHTRFLNLIDSSNLNAPTVQSDPNETNNDLPNTTNKSTINSNLMASHKKNPITSIYSFSYLPMRTQNLLNAQHEFDSDYALFLSNLTASNMECLLKKFSLKYNSLRQVHAYVSASSVLSSTFLINEWQSIESKLNLFCAQHNYDFNLINLISRLNDHSLNKYLKRFLGKLIISDMLNISNSTINNNFSTSGYFIYIIILCDCEFDETENNLLCPDEIDVNDFNENLKLNLTDTELALFTKWYTISKYEKTKYKLNLINHTSQLNELDDLFVILNNKLKDETLNNESLRLKYFKSFQQQEIEFVAAHIDPSQIVWLNLTSNESKRTKLNQMRFESSLKLLQSHVLTHNYRELNVNELNSSETQTFVCDSLRQLVEQYIEEVNKKVSHHTALKIDQRLAHELLKHYEIYKYLRVKNEYLNQIKPSRLEINAKFITQLNDYLKNKATRYPLVINNYKVKASYVTTDEIISKFISDSKLSLRKNRSIIYRFCGRTVISSNLTTLMQSVFHQLCYLLDIHESWSFNTASSLIENISRMFELDKRENRDDTERQIIIFLDRIDRLIRSRQDQKLLINLLDKLYASQHSQIKLVLTYSIHPDLFSSNIQSIKDLFKSHSDAIVHSLHLQNKSFDSIVVLSYADNLEKLKQKLSLFFKENNMSDGVKLLECLIELLFKSRYGLKQTELVDLLREYAKLNSISNCDYLIQLVWFMFKYFSILYKQFNLIETLSENNQLVYRLDKHLFGSNEPLSEELKKLLNNYFKQILESNNEMQKRRAYQELTNRYLVSNHEVYFRSFISNYQWFLSKLNVCDANILYMVQDMDSFKRLIQLSGGRSLDSSHLDRPENEKDEFKLFEHLFYETLYTLHQDPNQIYTQFKTYLNLFLKMNKSNGLITQMIANLDKHFRLVQLSGFNLTPFNYENLIENEIRKLDKEKISFNTLKKQATYLSKVVFLNSNTILALSDSHNEIKIWKINSSSIELIRSIKLNKTPRDLRLLNQKIAVVLVDRNLHLFDLNESKHVLDMNSTMSANVPFFEIHDQNHVVLLARNRLSVILMKVSLPDENSPQVTQTSPTKTYSADDDMFLFKVGEDRYLNSLLVSKNGQVMVCGDEVQKPFPLLVWNLNKRKLVYDLRQAKHEFITSIQSIGSGGKFVVCACQEEGELKNCLIVYDLLTGQLFKKLKAKFNYVSVEISEEANVLIACLENSQLIVYDLTNGSEKCIINNNQFPVNKIKMLDTKNIFITYDTRGLDWTLRAWDLNKLDKNPLISSFTCPTRIISCSINLNQFSSSSSNCSISTVSNEDSLIGLALYGIQHPLILRLTNQSYSTKLSPSIEFNTNSNNSELYNKIEQLNKEINL